MTFNINVSGGTHAGWRTVRPVGRMWRCCEGPVAGYFVRCPACNRPRPN